MKRKKNISRPLEGIRIIDLSRVVAGPYCTMLLGDMGAEVIKVEKPLVGDEFRDWGPPFVGGESGCYLSANRNKKSITLDVQTEIGRDLLLKLIRTADVVVENFKKGTMEKWGIGYDQLKVDHPSLIYCSITGYGQTGPYSDLPGYDFVIQALSGIMSITGPADGDPFRVGIPITDMAAGLYAVIAILGALRVKESSGQGQMIDISLLDSAVSLLLNVASDFLITNELPLRYGNAQPNVAPYQIFKSKDGSFALAIGNDTQFVRLCNLINKSELATDENFITNPQRVKNRDLLVKELEVHFLYKSTQEWIKLLSQADLPVSPVNSVKDILTDQHVLARGLIKEIKHPTAGLIKILGPAPSLTLTPSKISNYPPLLGQHTVEVLTSLGCISADEIILLRAQGII